MPSNGFGTALTILRERRGLSGRELSTLAEIDHAYEYRLESGEKTNPSVDAVEKLLRGLKPNDRDARVLKWLAEYPDTDSKYVAHVLDDQSVTIVEFTSGAAMVHRGKVRPEPAKVIERVRKILAEED
jgi:transcriptional regulator with XRE-family HTH domain